MRIVIDMQAVQTENRFRDVGRYVLSFAQAIVRNRGEHEVILALSGFFPGTIESVRVAFGEFLPQENIRVWYAPGPVRKCNQDDESRRAVAERIREAFLASLNPDVVFIPGFFEDYQDESVISIGLFAKNLTTVVALNAFDALQSHDFCQGECTYVLRKLENLKRADLLLPMQPLSVDEVCNRLEISRERVKDGLIVGADVVAREANTYARSLFKIFEELVTARAQSFWSPPSPRPKLAYVSPLPPERSGISEYSVELLPELARFYDIDVIVAQAEISSSWIAANCGVYTADWFLQNAHRYSRVLYHFGNSSYHQHMYHLLEHVPGVVVLHDFYLGNGQRYHEAIKPSSWAWTKSLYQSHGWRSVVERFNVHDGVDMKYPANMEVLLQAQGIIVHSTYSQRLANEWYGNRFSADWKVIPFLRTPGIKLERDQCRARLDLKETDFVVCSFGFLGSTKLNHQLLEAWVHSRLAKSSRCVLVFVGENEGGDYGNKLLETIHANGLEQRILITGWSDMSVFRNYLAAADMAVQLRTLSRGETSGTVLDCMNHALPTIVNANGSMAELVSDAVWMLPDEFLEHELIEALETLWEDDQRRAELGSRAQEIILTRHAPRMCAEQYAEAIEQFHERSQTNARSLVKAIAELECDLHDDDKCIELAESISHTLPVTKPTRQLFIDVSAICRNDLKTGIQRVVRALLCEMVQTPPPGYRIEPVYLTDEGRRWHYRYARKWASGTFDIQAGWMPDEPVEYSAGDIMLVADFTGAIAVEASRTGTFMQLKEGGVGLFFVVYDLLPIQIPNVFPPGQFGYMEWINAVGSVADGVICISSTVAEEFRSWTESSGLQRLNPIKIGWFHLGADVGNSVPTRGLPKNAGQILSRIKARPSFFMVGTIEPRKGYIQTLDAFAQLWQNGIDINLVIVGNEGWKGLPDDMRRTIPEIINRLRSHPELNKRLYWLEGISDEYLEKLYAVSSCLIAASEGEGFGLPLIEAAQHKLPIIARDIPVFREVAGDHAYYFSGSRPEDLAKAIEQWLGLNTRGRSPQSTGISWLTWQGSTQQLISALLHMRSVDLTVLG